MADDSNTPLFGQPAVSPETLRGRRAVNQALLQQGLDTSPIRSPWQGAARLAETLVGALGQGRLDKSELEARQKLTQDTIDFWNGGDPSRLLANPYSTPEALRLAIEGRKQHMLDVGTGYTPTNQFTGAQTNQTIPKNIVGTFQGPGGSMPGVVPGAPYNAPFRGAAPPPTPGMQSAPMAPARPAAPPIPDDMRPNRTFDERFSPTGVNSSGAGTVTPEFFRRYMTEQSQAKSNLDAIQSDMAAAQNAPSQLQALGLIENTARAAPTVTGLAGEPLLKLRQTINGLAGKDVLGETSGPELQRKMNSYLAGEVARGMSSRGATNFDFANYLENMPGNLMTSNKGTLALTDVLKQMRRQDLKLGTDVAGTQKDYTNYLGTRRDWFSRPENQLRNPITGTLMGVGSDTPAQRGTVDREGYTIIDGVRIKSGKPSGWR